MSTRLRSIGCFAALCAALGAVRPAAAQWDLGPAAHMADTRTNAVGFGLTFNWRWPPPLALRVYGDAEHGMAQFKPGLSYSADRTLIVDGTQTPQDPRADPWDDPGWDVHGAAYVTVAPASWFSLGPGYAHNGHDSYNGAAAVLIFQATSIAELDFEFLGKGAWRMRLSVALLP